MKAEGSATYRLVVEYDGTDFCGFQFQPTERTVAGELERALSKLFDRVVKVSAAGRTDAGVHALAQVISFVSHDRFPIGRLALALNAELAADVSVRAAAVVAPAFNARLSALGREYRYVVHNAREPSALARRWSHFEHRDLDLARMRAAVPAVLGRHDFVTFCGMLPERGGTERTLRTLSVERRAGFVVLDFEADGFLHRMVRVLAGSLLEIGAGRREPGDLGAMLAARDRTVAGPTAPAQGLFLTGVRYPEFASGPAGLASLPPAALAAALGGPATTVAG